MFGRGTARASGGTAPSGSPSWTVASTSRRRRSAKVTARHGPYLAAIAVRHTSGSVTPSLTIARTRDEDERPSRARASASDSSRHNASSPPSAAAPDEPAEIAGSSPRGRPSARVASFDHPSSMAMKAATFGRSEMNAGGDTSRLRKPAIVVVSGPVTATGVPARAEACRHAADVGSTATTRGCGSLR